jgi:hypothetical protein
LTLVTSCAHWIPVWGGDSELPLAEYFELIYEELTSHDININKELYRGELYCDLLKNFIKSCLKNLGEKIFSHKKNYTRTINCI